jgi:hypothetical protein
VVNFRCDTIYQEVPKLYLIYELRGLVDKKTDHQPRLQQFESTKMKKIN